MRLLASLAACAALGAHATTVTTDFSDLWYNAAESGWGVNIIQQADTLFLTFFVYGSNGQPTWYVASNTVYSGTSGNSLVFSGPLYQTNGPWFGGSFNPNAVGVRQVGTVTFTGTSVSTGTLAYTVDGVSVTKSITRQTWKVNDITGEFMGAFIGTYFNCSRAADNGYAEVPVNVSIARSGSTYSARLTGTGFSCTYTGPYTQQGRMGTLAGTYNCSDGSIGTVLAFEIEAGLSGITARAQTTDQFCSWSGRFGGVRRGP